MREIILRALERDILIDVTTYGRKTGKPHRFECRFLFLGGKIYVSGFPGKRDWIANLRVNPAALVHVKQTAAATLHVRARFLESPKERNPLLLRYMEFWSPTNPAEQVLRCVIIESTRFWVRLHLPFWGPMWPIGRIMRGMPLAEFTILKEQE